MGSAPRYLSGRFSYALLVIIAFVLSFVNFFFFARHSQALPNAIGVYSIRSVATNDDALRKDSKKNAQALTMAQLFTGELSGRNDVGDNLDFHGLTELQAVKFMLGCYGTGDSDIGTGQWDNFNNTAKTLLLNTLRDLLC